MKYVTQEVAEWKLMEQKENNNYNYFMLKKKVLML